MHKISKSFRTRGASAKNATLSLAASLAFGAITLAAEIPFRPDIPKVWDEAALAEWATPIAGINVRPSHISAERYYAMPVDNLRTYPVYAAGREPPGYWAMLQRIGPQPMFEPEKLRTQEDWIKAGRTLFQEMDHLHLRTHDGALIAAARKGESEFAFPDGTIPNLRWVPTSNGVALGFSNCTNCHVQIMPDGRKIDGPSSFARMQPSLGLSLIRRAETENRFVLGGTPLQMGDEPVGEWLYRAFGVPWRPDDVNARLKTVERAEYVALVANGLRGGAVPRWNGSLYFPVKIPDLIGVKDRKYLDLTGTHLNRGIGDIMRYAALVSFAETTDFGPHHMIDGDAGRPKLRKSDEALYALALYIESLAPPPNPNPVGVDSVAGEKIFENEGCVKCHEPPLYTNNKLNPVKGFVPPPDRPATLDVMLRSVGTDPGLALQTRKGTGYYRVPSLRGVWNRGHYLHDGAAATLEEMFDPERLETSHVRGGYTPPGQPTAAIPGHEFGLDLTVEERRQLIAFLRTL